LLDAVKAVGDMDQVSAEAYTTQHESGLRILAGKNPGLRLTSDISPEQLVKTLMVYRSYNDFVIVDLPRHLDMLAASVLDNADQVSVVTQQSFPHLHDTSRLLQILRNDIGIHDDQLTVVVNRYEKDSAILLKDIENALQVQKIVRIPNHYRLTSESVNTGVPLSEMNRRASVTKGLKELYQSIGGLDEPEARGAARTLHSFFRR
jgi:pilus assembly protein CpaE